MMREAEGPNSHLPSFSWMSATQQLPYVSQVTVNKSPAGVVIQDHQFSDVILGALGNPRGCLAWGEKVDILPTVTILY